MKNIVMFSGGIGSWAAARRSVDKYGSNNVICLFSDVKGNMLETHIGEDEDTYRFIDDAIENLGCEYVRVADGRDIWQVFKDRKFLGNSRQANCSTELKQKPAKRWLEEHTSPSTHRIVIGIDWTETHRRPAIRKAYEPYEVTFPMCDEPFMSKQDMIDLAAQQGLRAPRLYSLGFSHNNCGGGCVRAGQGQFRHLLKLMPERYEMWEKKELELRDYLGKDVSILSEIVAGEKRRLPLSVLRNRQESQVDLFDIGGCGCFTEYEEV
jgi:hypothetical protein